MADVTQEGPASGSVRRDQGLLLAVALNLWTAVVVLPLMLRQEEPSALEFLSGGLSFGLAFASSWGVGRPWASMVALVAYPLSLFVSALLGTSGQLSGLALVTATVSLAAYAATAAAVVSRRPWRPVETRRLADAELSSGELRRARVRTFVLSITMLGAFVTGVVIPAFAFDAEAWSPPSQSAARTFGALAAALVSVVAIGAMVGPAMRRTKSTTTPQQRSSRITTLILVAVFGTIVAMIVSGVIG